jgi:ADP-heptose:LPS heptosyltransferase/GT2 family glycosyltransferase
MADMMSNLKEVLLQQANKNLSLISEDFFEKFRDIRITIVMLSYGRIDQTIRSIQTLEDNVLIPFKLLVIDNNSGDEVQDKLKEVLSGNNSSELILLKKNLGYAGGRAYALNHVDTEYVMFLDNDIEVFPGTVEHLLSSLESDPQIIASAGNVIFPDGNVHLCGGDFTEKDDVLSYTLLGTGKRFDDPSLGKSGICKWVNGGSTIFRKDIINKYPYLSMGHFEDLEWCYRLNLAGEGYFYRSVEALAIHYHSPRFQNLPVSVHERRQYFMQYIKAIAFFYKIHKKIMRDLSDFIREINPIDILQNIAFAKFILESINFFGDEWFLDRWSKDDLVIPPLLADMAAKITAKEMDIGRLDTNIINLETTIVDKEREISDYKKALRNSERRLQEQEDLILQNNAELARLREIENSLIWRTIKSGADLIDKNIFPSDTKRGRIYLQLLKGLRPQSSCGYEDTDPVIPAEKKVAEEQPVSFVEVHCDNAISLSDTLEVGGWAVSSHGIERVEVYCNGTFAGLAIYGHPRTDVQEAFPSAADGDKSGFSFFAILEKAQPVDGNDKILIRAVDKAKQVAEAIILIERKDYYLTYLNKTLPTEGTLHWMSRVSEEFSSKPLISLVVVATKENIVSLRLSLDSLQAQTYPFREIIVCYGSEGIETADELKLFIDRNKFRTFSDFNKALNEVKGEFIAFLGSGDIVAPNALFEMVKKINLEENVDLVYSDEDALVDGQRKDFIFKPEWSPDLLLSTNYMGRFFLLRTKLFADIGGPNAGAISEDSYNLLLRATERARKISHVPLVLFTNGGKSGPARETGKKALEEALLRRGTKGEVVPLERAGTYRVKRAIIGNPKVSIIIPTAYKNPILLDNCLKSIVRKSTYDNYEIIMVDHTFGKLTSEFLKQSDPLSKLHIIRYEQKFNFSRMNNLAVTKATGDYFIFLNDDTEVITPDWIEAMLEHAQRPEVGVVGVKLLYPDDTIQHAGMFLVDYGGGARHAFRYAPRNENRYMGLSGVVRNCSAVTFACAMVSRVVFAGLKGFDENLKVEGNDLDFCLRAVEAGYFIVWTPFANLYHKELTTRVTTFFKDDVEYFWDRWRPLLERGDPFYNPNLTLDSDNYSLNMRPVLIEHHEPYLSRDPDIKYKNDISINAEDIKRILVVKLDHIGDMILSLPAIKMLRDRFPNARIAMLVGGWSQTIIEKVKEIDDILTFNFFFEKSDAGERSLSDEEMQFLEDMLRPFHFDLAIDLRRHPETRKVLKLSGARYTAGYSTGKDDAWLSKCLEVSPEMQDICAQINKPHIAAQMCRLIQVIPSGNIAEDEAPIILPMTLPFDKEDDNLMKDYPNLLQADFLVGIHASVGSIIRQWPIEHFARLSDLLVERNNALIVLFGAKSEKEIASQLYELMHHKDRMFSLIGKISLGEFISIVKYCHLFIGNISGPSHIAAMRGVPTLTIFGSQVLPHEWQPLGEKTMSVRLGIQCSPCYKSLPEQCPFNLKCLKLLWPEKVWEAVCHLMVLSGNFTGTKSKKLPYNCGK